ncbi:hypothetical protein ACTG9Q_17590 [Actinokineospora sp. 24-640]
MTSEPGSRLAEELSLLFAAMADQVAPWLDRVAAEGHDEPACGWCPLCAVIAVVRGEPSEPGPDRVATDEPACGWCPLCAVVAMVRGEPSALAAQSLERMADVVALLRAVLADRWSPEEAPHMPGFRPPEPPGRVQHIPVRRQ